MAQTNAKSQFFDEHAQGWEERIHGQLPVCKG